MSAALAQVVDSHPELEELKTREGAHARLERDAHGGERLAIYEPGGRVLFEYDSKSGRGMLAVAEGDLRLCAPRGAIELYAASGIRAYAAGEVAFASGTAASLGVTTGAHESKLSLERDRATLASETLTVSARESELRLGSTRAWADKLHASVDRAELSFGHVLRRADRVIEQAGNYFQRVSELCDLKAGRVRTLVKGSVWLKGEQVSLNAKDRVSIDGEHIDLG